MNEKSKISHKELGNKEVEQKDYSYLPATPEALLTATIAPGEGVVDRLARRFAGLEVQHALRTNDIAIGHDPRDVHDFVIELEGRVRRYLVQEEGKGKNKKTHPTKYAEFLIRALQDPAALTPTLRRGLAESSSTVIAELTPILRDLQKHLHDDVAPHLSEMQSIQDIVTPEGLLSSLRVGSADQTDTYSLFGALHTLATRIRGFPSLDLKEKHLANHLLVEDPLANKAAPYWKDKQRFYKQVYHLDLSRPEIIRQRSSSAASTLAEHATGKLEKQIAILQLRLQAHIDATQTRESQGGDAEDIKKAKRQTDEDETKLQIFQSEIERARDLQTRYVELANWIWGHASSMNGISEAVLADRVATLTFTWGDYEEIRGTLNNLEYIKRDNPELYAQLLGIQAGGLSKEATRSERFGNVLHIAFARSLHQAATSDRPEAPAFRTRMEGLCTLDVRQAPLILINEKQWEFLGQTLAPQAEGEEQKSGETIARALMLVGISLESYLLRKMFESPDVVEREKFIELLRKATPDEFIRLIKALPHDAKWYEKHDLPQDIAVIIDAKCIKVTPHQQGDGSVTYYPRLEITPEELVVEVKKNSLKKKLTTSDDFSSYGSSKESLLDVITMELWRTLPSEFMLEGNEFFGFLELETVEIGTVNKKLEKSKKNYDSLKRVRSRFSDFNSDFGIDAAVSADIDKAEEKNIELEKQIQGRVNSILAILNAHPDITQEQWVTWWDRNFKNLRKIGLVKGNTPDDWPAGVVLDEARVKTMQSLLRSFTPHQILESSSQVFYLFPKLFPGYLEHAVASTQADYNMRGLVLEYFFGKEGLNDAMKDITTPFNRRVFEYKILYRILSRKSFFSGDFINQAFFNLKIANLVQDFSESAKKEYLTDLVGCILNRRLGSLENSPLAWVLELLTLSKTYISDSEKYRHFLFTALNKNWVGHDEEEGKCWKIKESEDGFSAMEGKVLESIKGQWTRIEYREEVFTRVIKRSVE